MLSAGTCSTEKTLSVTVVPKPVAAFNYPPVICEKQTAVAIVNNSSVPGGAANINKWWWSIDNTISQAENPVSFIPGSPAPLNHKISSYY